MAITVINHKSEKLMVAKGTIRNIVICAIIIAVVAYFYFNPGTQFAEIIEIDGSSTVYPITQAVAEEFQKENRNIYPVVGVSGTGGGFKRFTVGETDINDASRPIKDSEIQASSANGIEYIEFEVALDGLAVVVNPDNNWVDYLSLEELRNIWKPNSSVKSWNDVRPEWPDRPIRLYGPGTDSGTFDYFTETIMGESGESRPDYTASEDDNVLIQGIAGDLNSLGYFGYAYYAENLEILRIVPIDAGNGPVIPSDQTISTGQYTPLSRPLFIYINKESLERPEVFAFVEFYMKNAEQLVIEVGYTPLPESVYKQNISILNKDL